MYVCIDEMMICVGCCAGDFELTAYLLRRRDKSITVGIITTMTTVISIIIIRSITVMIIIMIITIIIIISSSSSSCSRSNS